MCTCVAASGVLRMSLQKVAIVSGGTKGLGKQLCLQLAAKGYQVLALYKSDAAAAEKSPGIEPLAIDVANLSHMQKLLEHPLLKEDSEKEILCIHNASSFFEPKPFHLFESSELNQLLQVNIQGGFHLAQALLPLMVRQRRGTFACVLSQVITQPAIPKGFSIYAAAKAGLRSLWQALEVEYGQRGIKFYSFAPGYLETSLTQQWATVLQDKMKAAAEHSTDPKVVAAEIIKQLDHAL